MKNEGPTSTTTTSLTTEKWIFNSTIYTGDEKFAGLEVHLFPLEHLVITFNTCKYIYIAFCKNYKVYAVKKTSTEYRIRRTAKDIIENLENPEPVGLMETIGNKQWHELEQIVRIIIKFTLEQFLRV